MRCKPGPFQVKLKEERNNKKKSFLGPSLFFFLKLERMD
jgi:hypothetical protein